MKKCKHCDRVLIFGDNWCKSRMEKNEYTCKICAREKRKKWTKENPERAKEIVDKAKKKFQSKEGYGEYVNVKSKKWRSENPKKVLLINAKSRAKRKNIVYNLDINDIIIPEFCPILGIPLEFGLPKHSDGLPSLDRIIPSKGYTKGNVAVISFKANSLKNSNSIEDLEKILKWMKTIQKQTNISNNQDN